MSASHKISIEWNLSALFYTKTTFGILLGPVGHIGDYRQDFLTQGRRFSLKTGTCCMITKTDRELVKLLNNDK